MDECGTGSCPVCRTDHSIGYYFRSDGSINFEGVYVDDVLVRQIYGQDYGEISGTVVDQDGAAVPDVTISVLELQDSAAEANRVVEPVRPLLVLMDLTA